MFDIEEELKKLPAKPGVYLMHNSLDEIIYVGKAVRLKNRVRQYFQSSRNKSAKILKMVEHIAWFEYIVTDSELEALVLECNLIKEYRPRYNTMLTDDKGYPYIRVTVEEDFPRVFKVHQMKKDESRYFGPYTSGSAVDDTLELLQKLFSLRTCRRVLPRDIGKERPCLNYHMGRCSAPCRGGVSKEEYAVNVKNVIKFLSGDTKDIVRSLTKQMNDASEALNFEEAIRLRELLASVKHVAEEQKITDTDGSIDRDVIACAVDGSEAIVQVFFMRGGKMMGRDHFHMECEEGTQRAEILENFVKQFYSGTPFIPGELFLQEEITDQPVIGAWLSELKGRKVNVFVPKKGEKERLMELAEKNAQMVLDQDREKIRREELRTRGAVHEIEELLGLSGLTRMEAYDISNISGFESVGSMVVFENGKPKKNDYRKFRIRTVSGPDDYASMEEVLTRRLQHEKLPDLILMDGGKGQVHVAERVLENAGISLPVCGMVKDDRHNTRGLYYRDEEIPIDRHSEGFHLITRIQDEAHRFAITYHRGLHTKNSIRSVLSEIPGIGPKREKALIRHFESMDELKKAGAEEIASLEGFNLPAAHKVWEYLHPGEEKPDPEAADRQPDEESPLPEKEG
ncbi:MAG: excinuclease ABC subunit UvrC [Lachnospiraceae bacterium]|nr:excinuclease ABC subunit UvrC [Lachnospiraceae bacterium]